MNKNNNSIETICVQAGYDPKKGDPRVLPLYMSTTYKYDTAQDLADLFNLSKAGHIYSRISNPTVAAFEEKIAKLEGGVGAIGCSSGLSAETIAILNVCNQGDNFLTSTSVYGGTYNLFNVSLRKLGINAKFFDQDQKIEEIEKLIDEKTKVIYLETLANPALKIVDFDKFVALAKKYKILLMIDNTLATPYLINPIKLGANIVIHSTTKYLDGHAQAVGGVIVDGGNFDFKDNPRYIDFNIPDESYHGLIYSRDCANMAYIVKARVQGIRDYGMVMSPMNAYLTNLGTETLHLRMKKHSENALKLAKALQKSNKIEWVRYPGLETDREYNLAQKYFRDGMSSGMVTIGIKGTRDDIAKFTDNVKLFKIVTHIADSRSCLLHPATTTHRQLSNEELIKAGVPENLVRLSVGIEDSEDIINDILQALENVK